jgi:hypothetical protein
MARWMCSLMLIAAAGSWCAAAEPGKPLDFKTTRLVVFKDGYGLFVKEAPVVADADRMAFTDQVPDAAILGSFWATPSKGRLVSLVAGRTEKKTERTFDGVCLTVPELIKANVGKKATLLVSWSSAGGQTPLTTYEGTIKAVLEEPPRPEIEPETTSRPAVPLSTYFPLPGRPTRTPTASEYFVLDTGKGEVALHVGAVRTLTIEGLSTKFQRPLSKTESVKRLVFLLDKDAVAKDATLHLMHFGPGVRWIPTYRVDIADRKAARIDLQGELMNEAEDIVGATVDLVVGVPNFRFKDVVSPLVLETALRNLLQQAAPQLMRQDLSNTMFTQRASEWRGEVEPARVAAAADIRLPAELTSGGAQDLFVYSLPNLTLFKGQRAAVPIFTANVPFRHLYTWDIGIQRAPTEAVPGSGSRASPVQLLRNDVWHQVELTNNTDKPWTTGAALVMQGAMPLSQDLLTYTSANGGKVLVPVTVAIDVRGTYNEKEVGRDLNALQFDGDSYMRIRKSGELKITNYKNEDIDTVITCQFGGHCDSASDEGAVTMTDFVGSDWRDYRGHPAVNQHSTVRWTLRLKKGETKTRDVAYHYFTR